MVIQANGFNERKSYIDGIGNKIKGRVSYEDALKLGGLDFEVAKYPSYVQIGNEIERIPKSYAVVRTDTNEVVGEHVKETYKVVQNNEAFRIVKTMLDEGIGVRAAGTYGNGKCTFMLAQAEDFTVLGDRYENNIFVRTSHDGTCGITAMFTPVRFICQNGLVVLPDTREVKNSFSIYHTSDAEDQLKEMETLMIENGKYLSFVKNISEYFASVPMTKGEFDMLCNFLFPIPEDEEKFTPLLQRRREEKIADLYRAYYEDDLNNFRNTAYGAIMALSDHSCHYKNGIKISKGQDERPLKTILGGMVLLNQGLAYIKERYGYRSAKSFSNL